MNLYYLLCRAAAKTCPENDKEELYQLIDQVNEAPRLSALGLFDVNKTTLTSIFGTILTYLIITIQFQMTPK
jgi:hypothetical protein